MQKLNKKLKSVIAILLAVGQLFVSTSTAFALEAPAPITAPDFNYQESAPIVAPDFNYQAPAPIVAPEFNYSLPTIPTAPQNTTAAGSTTTTQDNQTTQKTPKTSSKNSGNGANSNNNTSTNTGSETQVNTQNNADVNNDLVVDVNTGVNDANKNMGSGIIKSGDGTINGSLVNDINNTVVNLDDLCGCDASAGSVNSGNGAGSNNNANTNSNSVIDVTNTNSLNLVNNEDLGVNTGKNEADKNMGDGVIESGDANISFTTINFGNNTGVDLQTANFDIVDTRSEDLIITWPTSGWGGTGSGSVNTGNGADSNNNANTNSSSNTSIDNTNNLNLDNNVTLYANTGDNSADANMGAGIIDTGDANIANNIINFLNNNIVAGAQWLLSTVNIYGDMSGNIVLPREADLSGCGCASDISAINSGNGSNSTNTTSSTSNDTLLVNNLNNAVINNNLGIDANTGNNSADKNMGSTSINTGNLDVNSNLVTVANTNTVGQGDTWWLVLVNNQGEWTGKIVGANEGDTIDGSGLTFGIGPNGQIVALNSGNGADSNNNANTTSNNTTTINNTNNAVINNNVNIVANTGNNTADKNMQGASITTGDVNVANNIVNFINNNFVGRKFVITVVNIFGKFSGDIVPPDQELPTKAGVGGVSPNSVALNSQETISGNNGDTKGSKTSSLVGFGGTSSLKNALAETGKVLENTKVAGSVVEKPITRVINHPKSGFNFNLLLVGAALAIVIGSTLIAKRKSFLR